MYGSAMAWWLKRVYWTSERKDASHWRTWEWLTDPPGRGSEWWEHEDPPRTGETNPRHGPHYQRGDLIVVCLAGSRRCPPELVRRCPAIYEVIAEPQWDPDRVDAGLDADGSEWGKDGDRWGVMTHVSCLNAVDSQDAPYPEAFGAELRSGSQSPHISLDDTGGLEARRLLEQIESGFNKPRPSAQPAGRAKVTPLPIEQGDVEGYDVTSKSETRRAHRKERRLVADYVEYLGDPGEIVHRHKIDAPGAAGPLYSDIFHKRRRQLIEAKASTSRGDIRMAIGQLADYARFIEPPLDRAILLPAKPSQDLVELLNRQGISAIWREGPGFQDNADGRFTHNAPARDSQ
jgi:hypothetical protein